MINKRFTTNIELEDYAKKYNIPLIFVLPKDLMNCFSEYPKDRKGQKKYEGGYIINLGNSDTGGSHWVCLYLTTFKDKKYAFYMDSYGLPMPREIETFALKYTQNILNIIENTKKIQALRSGYCGQFCLIFIYKMSKGDNPFKNFSNYLNLFKINHH